MNKKMWIVALVALMTSGLAFAGDPPKCDPKTDKCERICSLGWYGNKNGLLTWFDTCVAADGMSACNDLLSLLKDTTGKGAGAIKNAAADTIVEKYVGLGNESCEVE